MSTSQLQPSSSSSSSIKKARGLLENNPKEDRTGKEELKRLKEMVALLKSLVAQPYRDTEIGLSFNEHNIGRFIDIASRIIGQTQEIESEEEAQLKTFHQHLAQEVNRIARDLEDRLAFRLTMRPTSTELIMLRELPYDYFKQPHFFRHLFETVIWSALLQSVFSSPFACFGQFGYRISATFTSIFRTQQNGSWPEPIPESELWRSSTAETLLKKNLNESKIDEIHSLDPDLLRSVVDAREETSKAIVMELKELFGGLDVDAATTVHVVDAAFELAFFMAKQKCRLCPLFFSHGEQDLGDKVILAEGTSYGERVIFTVVPGISKWGDWRGENFGVQATLIPAQVIMEDIARASDNVVKARTSDVICRFWEYPLTWPLQKPEGLPKEDKREQQKSASLPIRRRPGRPRKSPLLDSHATQTRRERKASRRIADTGSSAGTIPPLGYMPAEVFQRSDHHCGHPHENHPQTYQTHERDHNSKQCLFKADDDIQRILGQQIQNHHVQDQHVLNRSIHPPHQGQYIQEQHVPRQLDQDHYNISHLDLSHHDQGQHRRVRDDQSPRGQAHHDQIRYVQGQHGPSQSTHDRSLSTEDVLALDTLEQDMPDQQKPIVRAPTLYPLYEEGSSSSQIQNPFMGFPSNDGGILDDRDISMKLDDGSMSFQFGDADIDKIDMGDGGTTTDDIDMYPPLDQDGDSFPLFETPAPAMWLGMDNTVDPRLLTNTGDVGMSDIAVGSMGANGLGVEGENMGETGSGIDLAS